MEISKGLQEEILAVQNKLKNAIRDHQICVGKLKDDPNNTDILAQIQKIHLHIVSLGRCQKQVVQRLRKEVETFKTENANGAKVSIASLLGLNNNNRITNNNEAKHKTSTNDCKTKPSKEDYEEHIVRNGDVPSPRQNAVPLKERRRSVETISGEDDVIEVSMDENSNEKVELPVKECKAEGHEKLNFLCALGLITTSRCAELQNKRAERKRRSTANPQFVYASLEVPTKRKRHSYLQSSGSAPQTRQTTARMNGPSPPPAKPAPPKSTSPPSRTVMKSLIPVQKSTTRPNILRNVTESKVFVNKPKVENGPSQTQLPMPTMKSVQSVGNKTVHIPGLPSSLTIERIENDSAICISCRNPGTLTICENCSSKYHVSCHSVSPAPPRICPKCAQLEDDDCDEVEEVDAEDVGKRCKPIKKDMELEEKKKERYELRERNSELRLQVYELEKRSQLLGQSLQLQHRKRQELLGKQEKTQRSIKRLVDFIKLMQLRTVGDSRRPLASTNFPPQPSSSQSPLTTSVEQASTSRMLITLSTVQQGTKNREEMQSPILQSSLINSPSRVLPISKPSPKCLTVTSYLPAVPSQKSTNHILLSNNSQTQSEGQTHPAKSKHTITCSTPSGRPQQAVIFPSNLNSRSPPSLQRSSTNNCPILSTVTAKSQPTGQFLHSTVSLIRKTSPSPATTSWSDLPSMEESLERSKQGQNFALMNCDLQEPRISYCPPAMPKSRINCRSQSPTIQKSPAPQQSTNQEQAVFSTHCSQAITSPISSPIVLGNLEIPIQPAKSIPPSSSSCIIKTISWNPANQASLRPSCSVVPSRSSSST